MKTLAIDIETYSDHNLGTGGVYRYVDSPEFKILLFAYSVDGGPVRIVDLDNGEHLPDDILDALLNPNVIKWAFNASFERICLSAWARSKGLIKAGEWLAPESWRCSMVWGSALGLPRSLDALGQALKLETQKMKEGKDLIKFFCTPPATNTGKQADALFTFDKPLRNTRGVAPEKWDEFKRYCVRDVEVENAIRDKLAPFPLPTEVWDEYAVDQKVNDFGIHIDTNLAKQAIEADRIHREDCMSEARELTGLTNPNSVMQLQEWLAANDCPLPSMSKDSIADAVKNAPSPTVRRVLEIRQELSRSSVKKYQSMLNAVTTDGRAHGLIQFYGAGRTGRWAGRLIQVQNLPRNYLEDLDDARGILAEGHHRMIEPLYGSLPDTLSQLIRTAFIPSPGNRFIVADYSAIEARVLAWLAGEETTLQAFRDGKDLYCVTASMMFGVPVEKHGPNAELRQKGKVAVLACGYQGGMGAIKTMGGERMGLSETEMRNIVDAWRGANKHIVNYWWDIERAAKTAITTDRSVTVGNNGPVTFTKLAGVLFCELPSGRRLAYPGARIGQSRFGKESITHQGVGLTRRLEQQETYGGKLVENITQAVARDLLAYALSHLVNAGHRVVMHIHDEVVIDAPPNTTLSEAVELMTRAPNWADGLPLDADGYECTYYQKD
ncbi:TPA: DNA polymerase [Corynebacterium striatum]|nr:DNA polymerase [Corynebacterium striatum]